MSELIVIVVTFLDEWQETYNYSKHHEISPYKAVMEIKTNVRKCFFYISILTHFCFRLL